MTVTGHATARAARHRDVGSDLQALRTDLEQQRRFRVEQLETLNAASAGPAVRGRETDDPLREVTFSLRAAAAVALADIDAALHRIDNGRYGLCQACHTVIPPKRLHALPMASRCMPCQRAHETSGSGLAVTPPDVPHRDGRRVTRDHADGPRPDDRGPAVLDVVQEWGFGSFPASDPPANW